MTQEEFSKRYTYDVAVDRIGGGGFGTVYKAYDNVLHRDVAIKVSEVKTTADGKKTFSLKDEFEALSHVPKHPNIANYEEFYSFKMPVGIFDYAVMQYYPDGNLSNAIKEGMTDEQKEQVAMQLLEGIDFLHKYKVVHRDLKPGNILIVKHGGHIIPLITDFGLSKAADTGDGSQFSNSFGAGTPRYSSPEQLQGKPLRFNTDLWSYGAIVYELFTSEQLFSPGSGASNSAQAELEVYNKIIHGDVEKLAKMPERWRKVAERCMVVDPEKRVKSAEELIYLLKGYEEATEVEGVAVSQGQQQPQAQPQHKPQNQPQPVEPAAKPAASKPVNNKPEPPKPVMSSGGKKKGKGLWIGLAAVAAIAVVLVLLLKPKEPSVPQVVSQIQVDSTRQKDSIIQEAIKPVELAKVETNVEETNVTVEPDPDTEAYEACRTVNDYRNYISEYGKRAKHYADAKKVVDKHVADSTAKAKELEAKLIAQKKAEDDARAQAENEKKEKEKEAFDRCTTIAACDSYLKIYPEGQFVEAVKAKKIELERQEANERAEAAARELLEKQRKEDKASTLSSLTITANGVSFVMKRVDGGTFWMGAQKTNPNGQNYDSDANSDEYPVHSVTVGTFYMGETEVTQALWKAVMGDNPSYFKGDDNQPVGGLQWYDCQTFVKKLNNLTGKNFRLPTEAEWEYAARGGQKSNRYKYAGSNSVDNVAVYDKNSYDKGSSSPDYGTHRVKSKKPNELGLYDMSGNVLEWCSDRHGIYGSGSQNNPKGPFIGSGRVLRGGCWYDGAGGCRVSRRRYDDPGHGHYGFRLVLPQ